MVVVRRGESAGGSFVDRTRCTRISRLEVSIAFGFWLLTNTPHQMAEPGTGIPVSTVKLHKPYFTPQQVHELCEKTRGKLSISQEEKARQHACTFIEAVGARIGL